MNTLDRYTAARAEAHRHQSEIADIGRAIHKLRTGHELHFEFRFCGLRKDTAKPMVWGEDDDSYPTPCYAEGTPLIILRYDHARWGHGREIAIPAAYFEDGFDYLAAEQAAIDATKERLEIEARKAEREAEAARLQHDRETYERLKAQFEGGEK